MQIILQEIQSCKEIMEASRQRGLDLAALAYHARISALEWVVKRFEAAAQAQKTPAQPVVQKAAKK